MSQSDSGKRRSRFCDSRIFVLSGCTHWCCGPATAMEAARGIFPARACFCVIGNQFAEMNPGPNIIASLLTVVHS